MQCPPVDLKAFPAVSRLAALGFISMQFHRRALQGRELEASLASVVLFPDMLKRRLRFCQLLVRHELDKKLAAMQAELECAAVT